MKIANIYTTTTSFNDELYNVTDNLCEIDKNIPTLIIGWQNVKKLYPDANILDWKIDENTFWTFGKRERRSEFDKRTEDFKTIALEILLKNTDYRYVNLITTDNSSKKTLFDYIMNSTYKLALRYGGMLYITSIISNVVYGISLLDIEYIGKNEDDFINIINSNKSITYIEEDDCDICNEIIKEVSNNVYLAAKILA